MNTLIGLATYFGSAIFMLVILPQAIVYLYKVFSFVAWLLGDKLD